MAMLPIRKIMKRLLMATAAFGIVSCESMEPSLPPHLKFLDDVSTRRPVPPLQIRMPRRTSLSPTHDRDP